MNTTTEFCRRGFSRGASVISLCLIWAGTAAAQNDSAALRDFISRQVGGLKNLTVPATNAAIPVPTQADGTVNPRYQTTEAKRYLGKLLFHDPVRTARININQGQPVDLPAGTAFGGTVSATDLNVQAIVNATRQTGSCGSCHIGEAAGKAGQVLNFNVGGEGRGYTDEKGNFVPRRRPQAILTKQRTAPLFAGDALVDALPTLSDVDMVNGQKVVNTPSSFYHTPNPSALIATGRLDELDSVGRESPSMIGFAFNNRLLLGGFAGENPSAPGSLNPFNDPAGENLTLLLLDAHRMLSFESAEILKVPAFVKLFRDAFPTEAVQADTAKDMTILVNDQTVFRATSTFLRTMVTRNTPFDRFLAGDDRALTAAQRRGAQLFFTPAANGARGAGCVTCHSGPMLNKQSNDPDVAGVGALVAENFVNIGIGDHPVQALNALARGKLDPNKLGADGFPYHAEDTGRQEISQNPNDAFKFRSLTLRQLKDGRTFMHNGSFTTIRNVVAYFNAGVAQDPTAGAAATLDARFTNPRGPGFPTGLGLTEQQVNDLADFLDNGLYDPAVVKFDPLSSTDTFQPNERDLTYSKYRLDLAALGAKDGLMPSGLAIDDNDPLARRDQGLEFLNVTAQIEVKKGQPVQGGGSRIDRLRLTNTGATPVDTHLLVVVRGLPANVTLQNASGTTKAGDPYLRVFLKGGLMEPDTSIRRQLIFTGQGGNSATPLSYTLEFLSGQGQP